MISMKGRNGKRAPGFPSRPPKELAYWGKYVFLRQSEAFWEIFLDGGSYMEFVKRVTHRLCVLRIGELLGRDGVMYSRRLITVVVAGWLLVPT